MLHQCGKRVKNKSQKVLGGNSYVCRSYREKTGKWGLFAPSPPILNKVKCKCSFTFSWKRSFNTDKIYMLNLQFNAEASNHFQVYSLQSWSIRVEGGGGGGGMGHFYITFKIKLFVLKSVLLLPYLFKLLYKCIYCLHSILPKLLLKTDFFKNVGGWVISFSL